MVDAQHRAKWERFVIALLATAWAVVVALPFVGVVRRASTAERMRGLAPRPHAGTDTATFRRVSRAATRCAAFPPVRAIGRVVRAPSRARRARRLDDEMARQVAVAVDLVGVGVGAGHTPYLAVELGARWSPPLVGRELDAAMRACSLGESFDDALREMGRRTPAIRGLAEALRTSARLGSPAAPALARLASELRLCFPLVGCILPAFALLTVVPAVIAGVTR
jgi:hypothetical protein